MRLSYKQKQLAITLFGTYKLTVRQFNRLMDERREASKRAYEEANDVDLLNLASTYTTLKKDAHNNYSGPCPMPGCPSAYDGFWVNTSTNTGGCHSCDWVFNGSGSGPVGFLKALLGLEAWEARDQLVGDIDSRVVNTIPKVPVKHEKEDRVIKGFSNEVAQACRDILANTVVQRYLSERFIERETWQTNRVGAYFFNDEYPYNTQAVSFPHYHGRIVCGMNRRIINGPAKMKTKFVKGSSWGFYHLKKRANASYLMFIEGEINALSVWQVTKELPLDIASVGPQGSFKRFASEITQMAQGYETLIIWADEKKITEEARRLVDHANILTLYSYQKLDANDLLERGALRRLLDKVIKGFDPPPTETPKMDGEILWDDASVLDQLLCDCGLLADEAGGRADSDYLQAEQVYMTGNASDLFEHYRYMKEKYVI